MRMSHLYKEILFALLIIMLGYQTPAFAYTKASIKNNTEYTISGQVKYAGGALTFCRPDSYAVGPGQTWQASSNRGACLITEITGQLSGISPSLQASGLSGINERREVTSYTSTGTAYAQFQVNAFGDRYRIFSKSEYSKASDVSEESSPGFRFVNHSAWPIAVSIDQVGCLYYDIVPAKYKGKPGVLKRSTGAVWFTLRAHIQPDGINPQTDWDCIKPVAELVGEVGLAAMSGGSSIPASTARIAAKEVAKAAIKAALRKALKEVLKFGAKELGEYLTATSEIVMPGQFAGYDWPFRCSAMPEYHITDGPIPHIDEDGRYYLEAGKPLTVKKVNTCGNDMMLASTKSETAEDIDINDFFSEPPTTTVVEVPKTPKVSTPRPVTITPPDTVVSPSSPTIIAPPAPVAPPPPPPEPLAPDAPIYQEILRQAVDLYSSGNNDRRAFEKFEYLANQGVPDAQYYLAYMYDYGYGVHENPDEAHHWYDKVHAVLGTRKLSNEVETFALVEFALQNLHGRFYPPNYERAWGWLIRAYDLMDNGQTHYSPQFKSKVADIDHRIRDKLNRY